LVLYGGYALGKYRRARTPEELQLAKHEIEMMPLGWARDNPAFRQFFASVFVPEGTPEQFQWFSELQRVSTSPETAVRLGGTFANIDVTEIAPRVQHPALVLHATGDAAIPFDQGRLLAALLPNARFVPLESRNHVLLAEEPAWARFLREVRAFLAEEEVAG
jgi:pimeloyl-ACP methyl ester carboxylesterase